MNAVTKAPAAHMLAGIEQPARSLWLRDAMAHLLEPHPDIGLDLSRIRPGVREEAARCLAAMEPVLRTPDAARWLRFLQPFRVLPSAPANDREFTVAVGQIAFALNDVPASILTANHQREALRALRFWPSPADLDKILRPALNVLVRERLMLEKVANAPQRQARDVPTEAERQAMAARCRALAAELRGSAEREAPKATARPLDPHALIAGYERVGTPASLLRARVLREQHGIDE